MEKIKVTSKEYKALARVIQAGISALQPDDGFMLVFEENGTANGIDIDEIISTIQPFVDRLEVVDIQ